MMSNKVFLDDYRPYSAVDTAHGEVVRLSFLLNDMAANKPTRDWLRRATELSDALSDAVERVSEAMAC